MATLLFAVLIMLLAAFPRRWFPLYVATPRFSRIGFDWFLHIIGINPNEKELNDQQVVRLRVVFVLLVVLGLLIDFI